jgi:hypothetical protein
VSDFTVDVTVRCVYDATIARRNLGLVCVLCCHIGHDFEFVLNF